MWEREAGFRAALDEAGISCEVVLHGEFTRAWGQASAERLLAALPDVDGVFAGNDGIAVGLAAALEARGRRVPADVAIVGYDNVAGMAKTPSPT